MDGMELGTPGCYSGRFIVVFADYRIGVWHCMTGGIHNR